MLELLELYQYVPLIFRSYLLINSSSPSPTWAADIITTQANPQYADVIVGKCRDFIYSDDDSSSVSTHGTGANIDQFELNNKIEGTESEHLFFSDGVNTDH